MTTACEARPSPKPRATATWQPRLRSFPFPYRSMFAICSDLDETPDRRVFREIMRFLNTTETTAMGPGVSLEVGNTIYFDMPPDQFAYWTTDDTGREMVRALIRSGHIDCLHSYGDLATTRKHVGRALDEMTRHDCSLDVWIDHAVAASNFGADIMRGYGDVEGSEVYHADLTCDFGIKFVWRGRVTSVIGQSVPRDLGGIFRPRHPVKSAITIGKEHVKGMLGRHGNDKYAMHGPNDIMRSTRLRDGRPVVEFLRSNPFWGGPQHAATAYELPGVITPDVLARLVAREGFCVFYTHLGKVRSDNVPFGPETCASLRCLAEFQREGRILITTTRRLLGYAHAMNQISVTGNQDGGDFRIEISTPDAANAMNPKSLTAETNGLTFYVPDPHRTRITINGTEVPSIKRNEADDTGQCSVSIPWHAPLEFPDL